MNKLWYFLGSVYFAVILIAAMAGLVIIGTFLEASTSSHLYASDFTYGSPVFKLLLWGFFLNILISALRRWPFQTRHIPFLITHFGLLMILSGVMVKSYVGVQGNMRILEGGGSHSIAIPNTYALHLEQRDPSTKQNRIAHLPLEKDGNSYQIHGIKLQAMPLFENSTERYEIAVKELPFDMPESDPQTVRYTEVEGPLNSLIMYDQGFGGYGLSTPWTYPMDQIVKGVAWEKVPKIDLKAAFCFHSLYADFEEDLRGGKEILEILRERKWPLVEQLSHLKQNANVKCTPEETIQILSGFAQQIYAVAEQLPELDLETLSKNKLFTAYLQLQDIQSNRLPRSSAEEMVTIEIEAPLRIQYLAAPVLDKLEDNIPVIRLHLQKGDLEDQIDLAFDPSGQGLKWPALFGEYLFRFQPEVQPIPYHVRLRQARQINHPNSQQPYSYEADLIISNRDKQAVVETTLSMNHVYETVDGYRFYLSNISAANPNAAKQVQLVVNRDPAKYYLTYPGAVILTLGILLLFWFARNKR